MPKLHEDKGELLESDIPAFKIGVPEQEPWFEVTQNSRSEVFCGLTNAD